MMKVRFATALTATLLLVFSGSTSASAAPSTPGSVVVVSKSLADTETNKAVVEVSWTPSTGAIAYSVSAVAQGETTRIGSSASCTATKCTSTVGDLSGGVSYGFTVTAVGSDASQQSASAVSFVPASIPGNPAVVSATTGNASVTLAWTAPANDGGSPILDYTVTDGANITQSVPNDRTSVAVSGLTAGNIYKFNIKARNSIGKSSGVDFSQVTAVATPSAPAAPTVSVSTTSVTVSWVAPSSNNSDITGYKVYLINNSGTDVGQPTAATNTSTTLTSVAVGTYTAKVVATNSIGDSDRSAASASFSVSAGSQDNTPVLTPTTFSNLEIGATQTISGISPSGGTVSFTATGSPSGSCTLSNGVITAVASGTCTIQATVAATAGYAAGTLTKTFQVKLSQTITFNEIPAQSLPGPVLVAASSSSGLNVSLTAQGACTVSGKVVTFLVAGPCTLTASQAGNANYGSAQVVTRSFTIAGAGAGAGGGGFGGGGGGGGGVVNPGPGQAPAVQKNYFTTSTSTKSATSIALKGAVSKLTIRFGKSIAVVLSGVKKGAIIVTTLKMSNGTTFLLPNVKVGSSRTYKSPAISLKKKGTHRITVNTGGSLKTLVVTVR